MMKLATNNRTRHDTIINVDILYKTSRPPFCPLLLFLLLLLLFLFLLSLLFCLALLNTTRPPTKKTRQVAQCLSSFFGLALSVCPEKQTNRKILDVMVDDNNRRWMVGKTRSLEDLGFGLEADCTAPCCCSMTIGVLLLQITRSRSICRLSILGQFSCFRRKLTLVVDVHHHDGQG